MLRTTIYLPINVKKYLKEQSYKTGKTMTAIIIEALGFDLSIAGKTTTAISSNPNLKETETIAKISIVKPDGLNKERGELSGEDYI